MKRHHQLFLICLLTFCGIQTKAQNVPPVAKQKVSIIPQPLQVAETEGSFVIQPGTRIYIDPKNPELKRIVVCTEVE